VKVLGKNKQERADALTAVWTLQTWLYEVLIADASLGRRVCGSKLGKGARGYGVFDGDPYAVAMVPITINPSGY
jgi:sensor domain CHASE-containing protein